MSKNKQLDYELIASKLIHLVANGLGYGDKPIECFAISKYSYAKDILPPLITLLSNCAVITNKNAKPVEFRKLEELLMEYLEIKDE